MILLSFQFVAVLLVIVVVVSLFCYGDNGGLIGFVFFEWSCNLISSVYSIGLCVKWHYSCIILFVVVVFGFSLIVGWDMGLERCLGSDWAMV